MSDVGKVKKAPVVKKQVVIDVDNTDEEVLKYDKDGFKIVFESSLESFKRLPDKIVEKLSYLSARTYWVSYGLWQAEQRQKLQGGPPQIQSFLPPAGARASVRLKIDNKKSGMVYARCRPDLLGKFQRVGWSVCEDPKVKTFGSPASGQHHLMHPVNPGEVEQILVCMSEADYAKNVSAPQKEKAKGVSAKVDRTIAGDLRKVAREVGHGKVDPVLDFDSAKGKKVDGKTRWKDEGPVQQEGD